jgi:hypothetical protein
MPTAAVRRRLERLEQAAARQAEPQANPQAEAILSALRTLPTCSSRPQTASALRGLYRYRYQSAEFQVVGFDELTQFSESQFTYLFSRLRRLADVPLSLRIRSASNPGGVGHLWAKERYLAGEGSRVFVPDRLDDNPHLDRAEYVASLAQLDPVTRARLLAGD